MTTFHCTMIRHGKTPGNRKNLYVGRTDESLLPEEIVRLQTEPVPEAGRILVSPMKRCRETAEALYPGREKEIVPEFREMDFGIAEYRSYEEMKSFDWYRKFFDDDKAGFPEGESKEDFTRRVLEGLKPLEGKLYGYRFGVGAHYMMGGLLINGNTQVLAENEEPIPGLYAAGEVTGGFHGEVRIDGSGTGDAFTFGHLAGEKIAEAVQQ